jgi:hypothetical protein
MLCFARGHYTEAARWFGASLTADREAGRRERLGVTLVHVATLEAARGQGLRALASLQRAVALSTALRGATGPVRAEVYAALAEQHVARSELEAAAADLARARAVSGAGRRARSASPSRSATRCLQLARRHYRGARVAAEAAERIARECGWALEALRARAVASEASALQGDRAAAWRALDGVFGDALLRRPAASPWTERVLEACARALRALGAAVEADAVEARARAVARARAAVRVGRRSPAEEAVTR